MRYSKVHTYTYTISVDKNGKCNTTTGVNYYFEVRYELMHTHCLSFYLNIGYKGYSNGVKQ